jgi:hypothetical protein
MATKRIYKVDPIAVYLAKRAAVMEAARQLGADEVTAARLADELDKTKDRKEEKRREDAPAHEDWKPLPLKWEGLTTLEDIRQESYLAMLEDGLPPERISAALIRSHSRKSKDRLNYERRKMRAVMEQMKSTLRNEDPRRIDEEDEDRFLSSILWQMVCIEEKIPPHRQEEAERLAEMTEKTREQQKRFASIVTAIKAKMKRRERQSARM